MGTFRRQSWCSHYELKGVREGPQKKYKNASLRKVLYYIKRKKTRRMREIMSVQLTDSVRMEGDKHSAERWGEHRPRKSLLGERRPSGKKTGNSYILLQVLAAVPFGRDEQHRGRV